VERFFDLSPDLLCITNAQGAFQRVNRAWEQRLGYAPPVLQGTCCFDWIHPDDRGRTSAALAQLTSGQTLTTFMNRYQALDGSYRCLEWQAVYQDGWVYAAARDVTERQRLTHKIQADLETERALNVLSSQFISTTTHEFRTPLGIISSSTGILGDYGDRLTPDQRQQHLNRIQEAVQHMARLMDDVLLLTRSETHHLQMRPEPMDLVAFCQTLTTALNLTQPRDRIQFQVGHCPPPLLLGDKSLLQQILTNLLSNALKYSPPHQMVQFTLDYHGEQSTFRVQDQGIGIPPEDVADLFSAFHRAGNVGDIAGNGLGLAIVKQLVDLHGGTITCHSQVNQGTTFTVVLPASCPQTPPQS
jgi:PAS domain S-box-containing protein